MGVGDFQRHLFREVTMNEFEIIVELVNPTHVLVVDLFLGFFHFSCLVSRPVAG
jgi:hypothetical protein